MAGDKGKNRDDVYSKAIRAGKRTYFFDVKATRGNDLYLTITESKKKFNEDGKFHYEKHKLFLYKEDFEKFTDGLQEAIERIAQLKKDHSSYQDPEFIEETNIEFEADPELDGQGSEEEAYTDVKFEDLGSDSRG